LSELSKYKGVIIEDSLAKGQVLQAMLEQLGFAEVNHFECAEDALSTLKKCDSEALLFLDLKLPGLSGQEVIKILTRDQFKGAVIISSACEQRVIDIALRSAAASGVRLLGALEQPYQPNQISDLLQSWQNHLPTRHARQHASMLDEKEIYRAFDEDRVCGFYQPIVDVKNGTIEAIECLARIWDETEQRYLLPASFLPCIIDISFLDNLALRLFQQSLHNLEHPKLAHSAIKLSVNIEPSQLTGEAFALSLNELARKNGIDPTRIIFELTEQAPINQQSQLETINILRLKNYNIAIDDFGSGYTNITSLQNIPFNRLKIDRRLIEKIDTDTFCQIAVDSVIALANEVNAEVIAEGIETGAQLEYLSRYESINIQGNFVCPALSFDELINWLEYAPYKLAQ
jgi:EAL domain-containing protein (putative c-di-GMP-specific phosphodiesterase class I)